MNIHYPMDEEKLHRALSRGIRRAKLKTAASGAAICLALMVGITTVGALASPAFAQQLAKLPVIGRVFRSNDGIRTAYDRGLAQKIDITKSNGYFELTVDSLLPTEGGFELSYHYRWLKAPEGRALETLQHSDGRLEIDYDALGFSEDVQTAGGDMYVYDELTRTYTGTYIFSGRFSRDQLVVRFLFEKQDRYALEFALPYNPVSVQPRTIRLDRTVGDYELESMVITPIDATLSYTCPLRTDGEYVPEFVYLTDAAGAVWLWSNYVAPGGADIIGGSWSGMWTVEELRESGKQRVEMHLESPYFAEGALALHIAERAAPSQRFRMFHISPDGAGGYKTTPGVELLSAEEREDGLVFRVRLTDLAEDARGYLATSADASTKPSEVAIRRSRYSWQRDTRMSGYTPKLGRQAMCWKSRWNGKSKRRLAFCARRRVFVAI